MNTRKSLDCVNKSQPLLAVRFLHFFPRIPNCRGAAADSVTLARCKWGQLPLGTHLLRRAGHNEASRRSLGFSPSILEQWLAYNRHAELHHINILHSGCSAAQCPPRCMYSSVLHQLSSLTSGRLGGLCWTNRKLQPNRLCVCVYSHTRACVSVRKSVCTHSNYAVC